MKFIRLVSFFLFAAICCVSYANDGLAKTASILEVMEDDLCPKCGKRL